MLHAYILINIHTQNSVVRVVATLSGFFSYASVSIYRLVIFHKSVGSACYFEYMVKTGRLVSELQPGAIQISFSNLNYPVPINIQFA